MNHLQKLYESLKFNLYAKLVSSLHSPNAFDQRFRVTLVSCFIPDFNLLSCELGNFTFKVLY